MYHQLPPECSLYGEGAYTDYEIEDMFREAEQVDLQISKKSNSKRKDIPAIAVIKEYMGKRIQTTKSQISATIPRHINAVTADGFILKLNLFVMAFQVNKCI